MSVSRTPLVLRLAPLLLIAPLATGCSALSDDLGSRLLQSTFHPARHFQASQPDDAGQTKPDKSDYSRAVLGRQDWLRALPSRPGPGRQPEYHWRYPDLQELLAEADLQRRLWRKALNDANLIVATNAAIGLARLGDGSGMEQLARAVHTPYNAASDQPNPAPGDETQVLKPPIRAAAAEALGALEEPSPVLVLRDLVDRCQDRSVGEASVRSHLDVPGLQAELVRGLARHVDPADDSRFITALKSPDADVRVQAVNAWADGRKGTLPRQVADLRTDPDAQVRVAALNCLVRRRHPYVLDHLSAALDDYDLRVRIAAVSALGKLNGAEAQAQLKGLLKSQAELIRAAAISALAESGAQATVLEAVTDKSWRARLEVARAMAQYANRDGNALAHELIDDPSSAVRSQAIESVSEWPLRLAGPVLLAAMRKTGYEMRKTAAQRLAARWPPAEEFPVDAPPERRAEVLDELQRRFRREIGLIDLEALATAAENRFPQAVSPETMAEVERLVQQLSASGLSQSVRQLAVDSLAGFDHQLVDALEQLALQRNRVLPEEIYRDVLPAGSPIFDVLNRLNSQDVAIRRRAAGQLLEMSKEHPLRLLAAARLADVAVTETDQLVWRDLLTAVASDPSDAAVRLAYTAIGDPSPDVRRRACEHLAKHPAVNGRHLQVLLPVLRDQSPQVVRAAIQALAATGDSGAVEPLKRFLATAGEPLRVEAAIALAEFDEVQGRVELERLSYSSDETVRRQVAVAMGHFPDPAFTGALIRLLDDRQGVRLAALESLPKVVGQDVANEVDTQADLTQRLEHWKRWHAGQHSRL